MAVAAEPAGAETVVVHPQATAGWTAAGVHCTGGTVTGSQAFEEGPAQPPTGIGSRELTTGSDGNSWQLFGTTALDDVPLADLEAVRYATYVDTMPSALTGAAPYFVIAVDADANGEGDGELHFYPPSDQVKTKTWQTWDAGAGQWQEYDADGNEVGGPVTLAAYRTAHPDAIIAGDVEPGGVAVAVGCDPAFAGFVGNVDTVTFKADGEEVTYDFEPRPGMTGGNGYRMVAADGGIFTFGNRRFHGSTGNLTLNKPIVGGATDVSDYDGYWMVASDGGVFAFNAPFYGSLATKPLTSPAVEIEPTPTGNGYWIVQADGTVTPFGGAEHFGDMKGKALNKSIIGMSVTSTGKGYWLVASDGGIFSFGDAQFWGSMGGKHLNGPIIDLGPMPDNKGYYLLGSDGGVFSFGSANFWGSMGDKKLNGPIVAMLVAPTGAGYWFAGSDGGVFTFGPGVTFLGSMGATKLNAPVLDLIN